MTPSERFRAREAMRLQAAAPCPHARAQARLWLAQDEQHYAGWTLTHLSRDRPEHAGAIRDAYAAQRWAGQQIEDAYLAMGGCDAA